MAMNALAKTFLFFLVGVIAVNLGLVAPFFLTLFLGWMLCEILRSFHNFMLDKRVRPWLASLLATLAATFVIVVPISVFAVATIRKGGKWLVSLVQDPQEIERWANKLHTMPLVDRFFDSSDEFNQWMMGFSPTF
jgi:predicted PurR-regulated permease PerM